MGIGAGRARGRKKLLGLAQHRERGTIQGEGRRAFLRKGVTLQLLWEEYREAHPDGYQRSQFCQLYRDWTKTIDVSMRQTHVAGEKAFVDYAGQTVPAIDLSSREIREAQIFIAVLGASNYQLARQEVEVRLAASTVEVLFKGKGVASHRRLHGKGQYSTLKEHMPDSHRRYAEWSPARIINWGRSIGPNTAKVVETILAQKPHPEQGFRTCLGIFRLSKDYGNDRIEAACERAVALGAYSYRSVQSILKRNLDKAKAESPVEAVSVVHENVRGAGYYTQGDDQPC